MYAFNRVKNECEIILAGNVKLNPHRIVMQYNKFQDIKKTDEWTIKDFIESFYAVCEEWDDHVLSINGRTITLVPLSAEHEQYEELRERGIFEDDLLMYDVETNELLDAVTEDGQLAGSDWCLEKYEWRTEAIV